MSKDHSDLNPVDQWMPQVANYCNHLVIIKLLPRTLFLQKLPPIAHPLYKSVGRTSFFLNTDPNPILTSQSNNLQTEQMDGDGCIIFPLVKYFFTSKLHITADCRLKIRSADRNHVRHQSCSS